MALDIKKIQQTKAPQKPSGKSTTSILQKEIHLFGKGLSDQLKEGLYLEMSILFNAGVDIRSAFDMIVRQQSKPKVREIFEKLMEAIIAGESLSEAFEKSGYFTPYEYYSLQIGEESGRIGQVLEQLSTYYSRKLKQRRQLMNALSYPVLILSTSLIAVSFMLTFIVPMFSEVFQRFGGELPRLTQMVINLSDFMSHYGLYMLAGLGGLAAILIMNRQTLWFQKGSAAIQLRLPYIGKLIKALYLARLCNSMHLLLGASVPLLRSIQLANRMVQFYPIISSLEQAEANILKGHSLHESLKRFQVYDERMLALIKVGEEVNELDTFFGKLSEQYTEEAEHRTAMLSAFLEPVMIIFLGLVVGFILVAMYLPMFELSTNVGM